MFSWYKYLIVSLFFSRLGFWSGNLFLIAPFPDRCLLVPFHCAINTVFFSGFVVRLVEVEKENGCQIFFSMATY